MLRRSRGNKAKKEEKPKIYVRRNGSRYVLADEYLRLPQVDRLLKELSEYDFTANRKAF